MTREEIIKEELDKINKRAKTARARVKKLLACYEYNSFYGGDAQISGRCENFEEYLERSALLPIENEMYGYELYYDKVPNDTLIIRHKVNTDKKGNLISYNFYVGDVERTLDKLTEGKCKIVEKVVKAQEEKYTALSCNL